MPRVHGAPGQGGGRRGGMELGEGSGGAWRWGGGGELAVGIKGLNRVCVCQGLGACPLSLLVSLLAQHCDPPTL